MNINHLCFIACFIISSTTSELLSSEAFQSLKGCDQNKKYSSKQIQAIQKLRLTIEMNNDPDQIIDPTLEATILHFATEYHDHQLMQQLLQENANPNTQNSYGNTPLYYAIMAHNFKSIQILLKYGADSNIKNNCNQDALTTLTNTFSNPDPKIISLIKTYAAFNMTNPETRKTLNETLFGQTFLTTYTHWIENNDPSLMQQIFVRSSTALKACSLLKPEVVLEINQKANLNLDPATIEWLKAQHASQIAHAKLDTPKK